MPNEADVIPSATRIHHPKTVREAVSILSDVGGKAMVIAGGTHVSAALEHISTPPEILVDLRSIGELSSIRESSDSIGIGSLVTYAQVERSDLIKRACPIVAEAASLIGDVEVRERETVGGALVHSEPGMDMPAVVLAMDGKLHVIGPGGPRIVSAQRYLEADASALLAPDELLTEIELPKFSSVMGSAYVKLVYPPTWRPILGVAAVMGLAYDGALRRFWGNEYVTCKWVRLAVTSAWSRACLAFGVEEVLEGMLIDESTTSATAELAAERLKWTPGIGVGAQLRDRALRPYIRRALLKSAERARRRADGLTN